MPGADLCLLVFSSFSCSFGILRSYVFLFFFFFNDTATTEIYTLSLHDALPISDFGTDIKGGTDDLPATVTSKDFGAPNVTRTTGSMAALSGGSTMSYMETKKSANRTLNKDSGFKHAIFKRRDQAIKDAKKAAANAGK